MIYCHPKLYPGTIGQLETSPLGSTIGRETDCCCRAVLCSMYVCVCVLCGLCVAVCGCVWLCVAVCGCVAVWLCAVCCVFSMLLLRLRRCSWSLAVPKRPSSPSWCSWPSRPSWPSCSSQWQAFSWQMPWRARANPAMLEARTSRVDRWAMSSQLGFHLILTL